MKLIQKPYVGIGLNKNHPLSQNLVGCWVINEATGNKVFDLSGVGNDGANVGADWIPNGMNFNGSSDYINLGTPDSLRIGPELTIISSIKRDTNSNDYEAIYTYGKSSANYGAYSIVSMSNGKIRGTVDDLYTNSIQTTNAITNGVKYQVALRCDGTNYAVYIDGLKASLDKAIISYTPSLFDFNRIGRSNAATEYFDGKIYYVYIYSRTLSEDEIAWLYREPYAMFQPELPIWQLYYEEEAPPEFIPRIIMF